MGREGAQRVQRYIGKSFQSFPRSLLFLTLLSSGLEIGEQGIGLGLETGVSGCGIGRKGWWKG